MNCRRVPYIYPLVWIVCAFLLSGCGNGGEPNASTGEDHAPVVETITIEAADLPIRVRYVGSTRPEASVVLEARVPGLIKSYFAELGERVAKDSVLARIEDVDYVLAVREAAANLELAQAQFDSIRKTHGRIKELLPKQVVPQERADTVEGEMLAAQAQVARMESVLEIAKERLSESRIISPMDGWVAERFVEIGANVDPGEPLFRIVDLSLIKVVIFVTEIDYGYLKPGQTADIAADAYPDRRFSGAIQRLGVEADERTNTFKVEIRVPNPEGVLKAGMSAEVKLVRKIVPGAVFVPQSAILYREGGPRVFILDEHGIAHERAITLGEASGDQIRVLSGLNDKETLVVKGQHYIREGSKPRLQLQKQPSPNNSPS
ncbi:MAG: efflux RND transporter periplasmic adaptor subunit [Deltaproteobacteria bacterium]|nr:efflux RND transporter periplasmic adaptor subunit [Deltaproteobacteria bacterium]